MGPFQNEHPQEVLFPFALAIWGYPRFLVRPIFILIHDWFTPASFNWIGSVLADHHYLETTPNQAESMSDSVKPGLNSFPLTINSFLGGDFMISPLKRMVILLQSTTDVENVTSYQFPQRQPYATMGFPDLRYRFTLHYTWLEVWNMAFMIFHILGISWNHQLDTVWNTPMLWWLTQEHFEPGHGAGGAGNAQQCVQLISRPFIRLGSGKIYRKLWFLYIYIIIYIYICIYTVCFFHQM